uniref:Uncharacterized protein n=1 Tax=Cucumis melo TaxID=3656 RepID=A0A9I9ECB2_CUCME
MKEARGEEDAGEKEEREEQEQERESGRRFYKRLEYMIGKRGVMRKPVEETTAGAFSHFKIFFILSTFTHSFFIPHILAL